GDPVDGGDHRLLEEAEVPDHRPRHPRELEHALHVALAERADDLADVAAGAEPLARPREDEDPHRLVALALRGEPLELGVDLEGERVELVGARERHRGHAVVHPEVEAAIAGHGVLDRPRVPAAAGPAPTAAPRVTPGPPRRPRPTPGR